MKKFYTLLLIFFLYFTAPAQTLINRTSVDTLGHAINYYNLFTGANAETGHVILAGNGYLTSAYEAFFIAKYSLDTGLVWLADLTPQPAGKRQFGTDVYFKKGYVYGAAFTWDSASGKAAINAIKINNTTGDTVWTTSYTGSYNGYNVPSSIVVDSSGNVFIAGTEQTGALDFKMIVIKYNSSGAQQWVSSYDSVGLYDGAVAAELTNTRVNITGFSGNGFGSWDFVQGSYLKSNGNTQQIRRHGNGAGNFSRPVGLGKDLWSNLYVGGTAAFNNGKTGIKIISYDTSFAQLWFKRMGDTSQNCEAVAMETDIWGNTTIVGTQNKSNGGKDIITAKYDTSGTQLWLRTISAPDPTKEAKAGDIALQDLSGGNLYITGSMSNGTNTDVVTFSYDTDGNLRWLVTYSRDGNNNDAGTLVLTDGEYVQVALTSYGSDSLLMGITYIEQEDTLGLGVFIPEYVTNHLEYSDYVFEGQVIATNPYFNHDSTFIYTSNTIEISKVFKGNLECGTVELITLGGTVEDEIVWLSHNLQFNVGEIGVFLAQETDRELSAVDFYSETNTEKLYMPYNEQGFIKYYYDGINRLITEDWGSWDSLQPLYRLIKYSCKIDPEICTASLIDGNGNNTALTQPTFTEEMFPHYSKQEFNLLMNDMDRQKSNFYNFSDGRSVSTLTYSIQNPKITGTSTKYFEFDVSINDNLGVAYLDLSAVRLEYSSALFGSYVVGNNKILVTPGVINADTNCYRYPIPTDRAANVLFIPATEKTYSQCKEKVLGVPQSIMHIKMEIQDCNASGTVAIVDTPYGGLSLMLLYSGYASSPNDTFGTYYDAVNYTPATTVPDCYPKILSFSPPQINAGVGDSLTITGYNFGSSRGNGGVYMKNCDDGGLTYMALDAADYLFWGDSLIRVIVPSVVDTSILFNNKKGGAGSGTFQVKNSLSETGESSSPIDVFYSVTNDITDFSGTNKKCVLNLLDGQSTGGYTFKIDSSVSNYPALKNCVSKAIHDWVCLTTVNFQVGNDTIIGINYPRKDTINMVVVGQMDDSLVIARTIKYINRKCLALEKLAGTEIDLQINRKYYNSLFADTNVSSALPSGKYDAYEFLLHEFGHAHSLSHLINQNAVMHYSSKPGPTLPPARKVKLYTDASCNYGGTFVIDESQNPDFDDFCSWTEMSLITGGNCIAFNSIRKPFTVNNIKFYPNPTYDALNIQYSLQKNSSVQIQVFGIIGNLIFQTSETQPAGEQLKTIQTSDWANGFYLINVRINNQNNASKIIKN